MLYSHQLRSGAIWQMVVQEPFNELILSWNMARPHVGEYQFYVRIKTTRWSNWLPYAFWGADSQSSFQNDCLNTGVGIFQDTITIAGKPLATAFEVKVEALNHAPLDVELSLFACATDTLVPSLAGEDCLTESLYLPLKGISQMDLKLEHSHRLCSPVSVAACVGYIMRTHIDPLTVISGVYDHYSDIYGNWSLNVAQAYTLMDGSWNCWVERLPHFNSLKSSLSLGVPIVVSVKGPLPGSALPYKDGHLMVVCGYEAASQEVLCMDPAFLTSDQTLVKYKLDNFLQAWNRRGRIAYVFAKK